MSILCTIAALARADCKGDVCIGSVDDYQFVVRQVILDRMGKRYGIDACYDCGINAGKKWGLVHVSQDKKASPPTPLPRRGE